MQSELQSILDDIDQLQAEVLDSEYRPSAEQIDRRLETIKARLLAMVAIMVPEAPTGDPPNDDILDLLHGAHSAKD